MSTATEKPSWATSGESLLNVPQTERVDDAGEPSEMKSGDRPSLTGRPLEQPADMVAQTSTESTASPEAPLVSDGKKAPPDGPTEAKVKTDDPTATRK